jgi:serine/threonine protein kinase
LTTVTASAYPDALPSQYRLHWYVLERVLGQGGFGITYLARDTNLDQAVAIKEYLPVDVATRRADATVQPRSEDQSERYRWGLDRFIREARTLAKFDHPSIVRVLSVFEQNGTAYMVMRFEEGENFAALLDRRHTLGEEELVRVLLPVLDGLKLVHDAGFIHRDIKPDNIHIRDDGSPVLLDFGSARHSMGHARTVTILVAPGYAPFEQYYSSGEDQGPWTDIYSLGATCYRAIAGVAPMDAIARSKGILGSTRELLVPATAIGAGRYSERFLTAVDHALAFAEKDRPATLAHWRRELTGERPAAAPPTRPAAAPATPPGTGTGKVPVARTAAYVAVIAAVAVIAGGFGAYLYKERLKPDPTPVADPKPAPPKPPADTTAAEQEKKEKKARDEILAKAERDRQEEQKRLEEAKRDLQRELEEKRKLDAERARKERASAKKPQPKRADPPVAEVKPAPPIPTPAPPPAPQCPQQGEVAIYNCYRELARVDALAALKVGELFEAGRGVAKSNNTAYYWYAVSELRGAPGAKAKKDAVAARLQPLEIDQMDKLARNEAKSGK